MSRRVVLRFRVSRYAKTMNRLSVHADLSNLFPPLLNTPPNDKTHCGESSRDHPCPSRTYSELWGRVSMLQILLEHSLSEQRQDQEQKREHQQEQSKSKSGSKSKSRSKSGSNSKSSGSRHKRRSRSRSKSQCGSKSLARSRAV